jgi:16S rRNA processing protein RimM
MNIPQDLMQVGHVTGAYGIHGWIRIKPYSADADALLHAKTWWLNKPDLHDVDLIQVRHQGEDVVAQLVGVADRNSAEALKGATVQVRRSHFPVLSDGEFYWVDLIGLKVVNLEGEALGLVHDLMDNGAHPILRVRAPAAAGDAREWLIPFVEQFVKTVDQAEKTIIVDWGLDF